MKTVLKNPDIFSLTRKESLFTSFQSSVKKLNNNIKNNKQKEKILNIDNWL